MGVDACPGGQAIKYWKRRRGIGCINSGVAQSQGVGSRGGSKYTKGDGKISRLQLSKVGQG